MSIRESIADLAKGYGVQAKDMIAMSPITDPFYMGSKSQLRDAQWFGFVFFKWKKRNPGVMPHLRRIHYWAVSQKKSNPIILPIQIKQSKTLITNEYLNTIPAWQFLCKAATAARYLNIIPLDTFVDMKNPQPIINFRRNKNSDGEYDPDIHFRVDDFDTRKPYLWINTPNYADMPDVWEIVICCEKTTVNDILIPKARQYHATLRTFQGEASLTAVVDTINRSVEHGKKVAVFYISDFDPAGNSMPNAFARKLEYLQSYEDSPRCVLHTVALTLDQVQQYELPRTPLKKNEKRGATFEAWAGEGGVELDALPALYPGVLEQLIDEAVEPYFDQDLSNQVDELYAKVKAAVWEKTQEIAAEFTDEEHERFNQLIKKLQSVKVDIESLYPEDSEKLQEDNFNETLHGYGEALLDTSRGYVEQMNFYHEHRGKDIYFHW